MKQEGQHYITSLIRPEKANTRRPLHSKLICDNAYAPNEELNDLYSSPNIVRVIKWRRMRWTGHVARIEEGRGVHKVLVGET